MLKRGEVEVGAWSSRLIRASRLRLNLAVTPAAVIIGDVQHTWILDEIGANDQQSILSENTPGVAKKIGRLMRLEIADGRAREKPDTRVSRNAGGSSNGFVKSAATG